MEIRCPTCDFRKDVPAGRIPSGAAWVTCPRCEQRFQFAPLVITEPLPDVAAVPTRAPGGTDHHRKGAAWEDRETAGLWPGFLGTVREILFSPSRFFSGLDYRLGLREPLAFGLLTGGVGSLIGYFWQFLMLAGGIALFGRSLVGPFTLGVLLVLMLVFVPLFVLAGMFVTSATIHLCLKAVGAGKHGFEGTFRVISYSQATQMWGLIPFVGGWIGWVWRMVVQMIGLRAMHETTYLRLSVAFLLPLGVFLLLLAGVLIPLFIFFVRPHLGAL